MIEFKLKIFYSRITFLNMGSCHGNQQTENIPNKISLYSLKDINSCRKQKSNNLFDPREIIATQSEYSNEFELNSLVLYPNVVYYRSKWALNSFLTSK